MMHFFDIINYHLFDFCEVKDNSPHFTKVKNLVTIRFNMHIPAIDQNRRAKPLRLSNCHRLSDIIALLSCIFSNYYMMGHSRHHRASVAFTFTKNTAAKWGNKNGGVLVYVWRVWRSTCIHCNIKNVLFKENVPKGHMIFKKSRAAVSLRVSREPKKISFYGKFFRIWNRSFHF